MILFIVLKLSSEVWVLIGIAIGAVLTGSINYLIQRSKFEHNKEMFYLQNMSKEKVKEHLLELLNHKKYPERKFETIRKRIGAYSDEELRLILIEVGGIKVKSKNGEEIWYLKERNNDRKNPSKEGYS